MANVFEPRQRVKGIELLVIIYLPHKMDFEKD